MPASRDDIPERLLTQLWQRRAARQAWFRVHGGPRVRVLYPGQPSHTAGPDFRNALLEVEGVGLVRGDVEIHVRQKDWAAHGHGDDPRYNGVVLHAALETQSADTKLRSGIRVPVISLAPLMTRPEPPTGGTRHPLWELLAKLGYPRPKTAVEMGSLLDRAGDDRFAAKSHRFQAFLEEQDPNQTLYQGLLEGLGYRQNQHPFQLLAQRASYRVLQQAALRLPQEDRPVSVQSWLTILSGLAPTGQKPLPPFPRVGFGPPLPPDSWHCFRVRPANHPLRRIAGAAALVVRFLEQGLVVGLRCAAESGKPGDLVSALAVPGACGTGAALVGQGRARDLAVNVLLPLLYALTQAPDAMQRGPATGQHYLDLFHRFGKLQGNELTRETAEQLLDPAWEDVVTSARHQQGLLQLHSLITGAR